MKLVEFYKKYPTEKSCRIAYKKMREKEGIYCNKCGHSKHYWKKNRELWECKQCGHRTTLRSGNCNAK